MSSAPDEFLGWPQSQKVDRYQRVLEWHDYVRELNGRGSLPCVWGSHQLLARAKFVSTMGLTVSVFRVSSWGEFDELMLADPLRDVSRYVTVPLQPLLGDREEDYQRFADSSEQLLKGGDPLRLVTNQLYRTLFAQAPSYVGEFTEYEQVPPNSPTFAEDADSSGKFQVMLMGVNPEEAVALWDDVRANVHYEKVNWWHDYVSKLSGEGKVSHVWAAHNFFDVTGVSGLTKGAGVAIYEVDSFDEFDALYRADPIREMTVFWSVLLQSVGEQQRQDQRTLDRARERLQTQ